MKIIVVIKACEATVHLNCSNYFYVAVISLANLAHANISKSVGVSPIRSGRVS